MTRFNSDSDYQDWLHQYDEPSASTSRVTCAGCGVELFTGSMSYCGKTYCWPCGQDRFSPTMSQAEKRKSA